MGFGFVIVKFSLFLTEISLLLDARGISAKGYSAVVGLIMVAVGVVIALLAFLQYRIYTKQLSNKTYVSTTRLSMFITLILLTGGILLILYLGSIVPR
jgi:putative membrane protein